MHIVYVISPSGGPETYVKTLLPAFEFQGHRVSIIYLKSLNGRSHGFSSNVFVRVVKSTNLHYFFSKLFGDFRSWTRRLMLWELARGAYKQLLEIHREEKVDVVEILEGFPVSLFKGEWKVVIRAHGSDWTFRHFCKDKNQVHDLWLIRNEKKWLERADAVSAISQHLADHLSECCDFPKDNVEVIPYPINVISNEQLEQKNENKTPTLMALGRLEKRKGTHVLLAAMKKVWQKFPETKVYLLGDEVDWSKDQLLEMVPSDKREQVILPGFVSHEDISDYYGKATLLVAPTQYETFGFTVLEAMAHGLPVVATDVGAISELVEHKQTGLLVSWNDKEQLADAIISLLSQKEEGLRLGRNGYRKAQDFYNLARISQQMLAFYSKVMDKNHITV